MDVSPDAIKALPPGTGQGLIPQDTGFASPLIISCAGAFRSVVSGCTRGFLISALAGLCCFAFAGWLPAQQAPKSPASKPPSAPASPADKKEGFYDVEQLERLFMIAKESGFGEEELRRITLEDEKGKTVNAWAYLQEMKQGNKVKDQGAQDRLQKIFLTVQDVLAELHRREKEDLKDLRDKSVFKE